MADALRDLSRQNFLGEDSAAILASATIAIVGLGGGGSHIAQQFGHLGANDLILIDDQIIENSNLNRLVGGTLEDVARKVAKVDIAARAIRALNTDVKVEVHQTKWQTVQSALRRSTIVFGCVDSYTEREQLERFCRRFAIVYVDIGMDVHAIGNEFAISGQVIASVPGEACMRCFGFITEEKLAREAERYGAAGFNPQVVWPNGVLASTAVGVGMNLLTPWHSRTVSLEYLEYDGNAGTVERSKRIDVVSGKQCPHFKEDDVGDPYFDFTKIVMS